MIERPSRKTSHSAKLLEKSDYRTITQNIRPFITRVIVTLGNSLEAGSCAGVIKKNAEKHLVGNAGLRSPGYRDEGGALPPKSECWCHGATQTRPGQQLCWLRRISEGAGGAWHVSARFSPSQTGAARGFVWAEVFRGLSPFLLKDTIPLLS